MIQKSDSNIIRVQQKVTTIGNEFRTMQVFMMLCICVEHYDNIIPWFLLMSSFVIWKKSNEDKK
jgi:hypothetical protein